MERQGCLVGPAGDQEGNVEKQLTEIRTTPQNERTVGLEPSPAKGRPNDLKYLSTQEICALFEVITHPRDRAIFRLVYHRGLRASEVGKLDLSDYREQEGRLYVHRLKRSFSGEYRLVEVERDALQTWLKQRGRDPGPLFPSRNHRPISRWALDELM